MQATEDERIEITQGLLGCGWQVTPQIYVASNDTTADDQPVDRAALVGEITNKLAAIYRVMALRDFFAEIRRQQRTDAVTADMGSVTTE